MESRWREIKDGVNDAAIPSSFPNTGSGEQEKI